MSAAAISSSLRDTLLEITRIDSPIGEEKALCDHVEQRLGQRLGAARITRFHDSLVVRVNERASGPRIALVGHLDTVRTVHDGPARIEGDLLYGAGAADMKSGLAVMLELAERMPASALPDLTLVFYEREEGPFAENRLGPMLEHFELLRKLDLAICLEPSNNFLQLGCMGSLHATVRFRGKTSHSARPWQGENAIYKSIEFLRLLSVREPHDVLVDGYLFREVASATIAQTTGRGRNVIPDEFDLNVNYRFAPGRTPEQALADVVVWVGGAASVDATDLSPAGRPHADHPLVRCLAESGVAGVQVKQAWTDVARFDALGVPAVNFGPGTQSQAHQRNEYTELPLLGTGYQILEKFLTNAPTAV
ncbi:MAG TPA: succinyl-diaminopimelate desuccinylase [Polyangiales bacterium]|nr:succinyl-diaminopimelate desuccinylase [Polyangiales bacterium]